MEDYAERFLNGQRLLLRTCVCIREKGAVFWNTWKGRFCFMSKHVASFGACTRLSNCKVLSLWNHIYRTTLDRPFLNYRTPRPSSCHPPERIYIAGMFRQNRNSMYLQYFCYQIAFT